MKFIITLLFFFLTISGYSQNYITPNKLKQINRVVSESYSVFAQKHSSSIESFIVFIKISTVKNNITLKVETNIDTSLSNEIAKRIVTIPLKTSDIYTQHNIIIPFIILSEVENISNLLREEDVIINRKYLFDMLSAISKLKNVLVNEPITIFGYKKRKIE